MNGIHKDIDDGHVSTLLVYIPFERHYFCKDDKITYMYHFYKNIVLISVFGEVYRMKLIRNSISS